MHPTRSGLSQGQAVLGSSISPVTLKAVARMLVRQHPHRTVPQDLRHHARRRDRGALAVRPRQALNLRPEFEVPIREAAPGVGAQAFQGAPESLPVRGAYAVTVDPPSREGDDAESPGTLEYLLVELLAQADVEGFGVVYTEDLTLPQNDRRREEWPSQSTASSLIRTR